MPATRTSPDTDGAGPVVVSAFTAARWSWSARGCARRSLGKEFALPGWREAGEAGWLAEWALSLMLMNVATRKFGRAVRLAEAGVPSEIGSGLSKSTVSRRFKALTEARLAEWMASDLSQLDLLVIRIDGLHMTDKLLMIGAAGIDVEGHKHPLGMVEGATENTATVQALADNLRA